MGSMSTSEGWYLGDFLFFSRKKRSGFREDEIQIGGKAKKMLNPTKERPCCFSLHDFQAPVEGSRWESL